MWLSCFRKPEVVRARTSCLIYLLGHIQIIMFSNMSIIFDYDYKTDSFWLIICVKNLRQDVNINTAVEMSKFINVWEFVFKLKASNLMNYTYNTLVLQI